MLSITSNSKMLRLIFHIFCDNQAQKLSKKLKFGQLSVSTPLLLLTMLKSHEQKLRQAMLWVRNIVEGEWGIFNTLFKTTIIFCH